MSKERKYENFEALDTFFDLMRSALAPFADGEHYLDMFAEDATFEYPCAFPMGPHEINGRSAFISYLSNYGDRLFIDSMSGLVVHRTAEGLIILEYASHGRGVKTGKVYANRYISVVTVRDRKIVNWRDYWNQLAVIDAIGSLDPVLEQLTGPKVLTS